MNIDGDAQPLLLPGCRRRRSPAPDGSGLSKRNQSALGVSLHTSNRHLMELQASPEVYQKSFVIGNGRLWILFTFDISIAAAMANVHRSPSFTWSM